MNHPAAFILMVLLPTLFFAWQLPKLEVNSDVPAMFHSDDPDLVYYEGFYKEFGNEEFFAVLFRCEDVFDLRILRMIDRLTKRFEELPGVNQVFSVTSFSSAYNKGDTLVVGALEDELSYLQPSDMESIRNRILSDPLYQKVTIVQKDGKGASINIALDKLASQKYKKKVASEIRKIIMEEEKREGIKMIMGGIPFYLVSADEAFMRDSRLMVPVLVSIVFFVLFLIFRSYWLPSVPLIVAGISIVWTFGFVVVMGKFITSISEIVLPLILIYGILTSVHFLSAYRQMVLKTQDRREAILKTVAHITRPCLWASVTTAIGFLSLLTSSVTVIQDFGLYASFGVMVSYLLTFTFLPLGLDWLGWKMPSLVKNKSGSSIQEFVEIISGLAGRYSRSIVVGTVGIIVLFVFWMGRVTVDTNYLSLFREDTEVIQSERLASEFFGSWAPIEFSVRYKDGRDVLDYAALQEIAKLQTYLESFPPIDKSLSVADMLKKANQELHGGDPNFYVIPSDKMAIERLAIFMQDLGGRKGLSSYLANDWSRMRLTARSHILPSKEFVALFEEIE
ncbi:MAG: MMPL family transporter, partial [Deltaproteobacteria bacterium]|nr:MMPL family transporter [Deltaproteobacteria bacterium]